jgi:outer membrane protein
MNKLQITLFSLLGFAVAVLFYLQFSSNGKKNNAGISTKVSPATNASSPLKVAYIDLDSIREKYDYFKLKNKELENEKVRIESEIENGLKKLESDRNAFAGRGASISQEEMEKFQYDFQNRYQALGQRRETLLNQHLANQNKALDDIQKRINDFLEEYNKMAGYHFIFSTGEGNLTLYHKDTSFNITNEVIEGLNDIYRKEKKK